MTHRTVKLTIMLDDNEAEMLHQLAARKGLNKSDYVRQHIRDERQRLAQAAEQAAGRGGGHE